MRSSYLHTHLQWPLNLFETSPTSPTQSRFQWLLTTWTAASSHTSFMQEPRPPNGLHSNQGRIRPLSKNFGWLHIYSNSESTQWPSEMECRTSGRCWKMMEMTGGSNWIEATARELTSCEQFEFGIYGKNLPAHHSDASKLGWLITLCTPHGLHHVRVRASSWPHTVTCTDVVNPQ